MKVFKVVIEVVCDSPNPDWIAVSIDEQLNAGEAIKSYEYEELEHEPS